MQLNIKSLLSKHKSFFPTKSNSIKRNRGWQGLSVSFGFLMFLVAGTVQAISQFAVVPYHYEIDNTAAFNVTVPLVTPPGVNSMTPDLALNYRSGSSSFWPGGPISADGQAWAHWQVSGFSWIGACTEKTLQYGYTEPKPGLCVKNGGREVAMVFVSDESGTYYIPDVLDRDMAADTRLYSELNGNDGTYGEYRYRLERRDKGTVTYFKKHSGMPDVGLISYKVDRFGNSMAYEWVSPGIRPNLRRPKSIVYGDGHLKVSLEWSPLPTPLTAVSHELNIPSSIKMEVRKSKNGSFATKYSYHMVNELAQGNTIIGLGEVALCPGSHYSACKRKLELEYGLVSNGTNGMGMGGLSKVIQPMANNIENSHIVESYISYVSGDKITIGSVSDSKVRGRRVNVNRKGKRGHHDDGILYDYSFENPAVHPAIPGKFVYLKRRDDIRNWSGGSFMLSTQLLYSGEEAHFGRLTHELIYAREKGSNKWYRHSDRYISYERDDIPGFVTRVDKTEYYNQKASGTVITFVGPTGNLGSAAHPIYKMGWSSTSKPGSVIEDVFGSTKTVSRMNYTTWYAYHSAQPANSNYKNYLRLVTKNVCEPSGTQVHQRCNFTKNFTGSKSYVYNVNGSIKTIGSAGHLGAVDSSPNNVKSTTSYGYNGIGRLTSLKTKDAKGRERVVTYEYDDALAITSTEAGVKKVMYGGSSAYNYAYGHYNGFSTIIDDSSGVTSVKEVVFTYGDLGSLYTTTQNGKSAEVRTYDCGTPGVDCSADSGASYIRVTDATPKHKANRRAEYYDKYNNLILHTGKQLVESNGTETFVDTVLSRAEYDVMSRPIHVRSNYLLDDNDRIGESHTYYEYDRAHGHVSKETRKNLQDIVYTYEMNTANNTLKATQNVHEGHNHRGSTETVYTNRGAQYTRNLNESNVLQGELFVEHDLGDSTKNYTELTTIHSSVDRAVSTGGVKSRTSYSDDFGFVFLQSSDAEGVRKSTYDSFGLVSQLLHYPAGEGAGKPLLDSVTTYDDAFRPLSQKATLKKSGESDKVSTLTYSYDDCQYGIGMMCSVAKSEVDYYGNTYLSSKEVVYDARQRVTSLSELNNGKTFRFDFKYNDLNELTRLTYPSFPGASTSLTQDFLVANYAYNSSGVVKSITGNGGVKIWERDDLDVKNRVTKWAMNADSIKVDLGFGTKGYPQKKTMQAKITPDDTSFMEMRIFDAQRRNREAQVDQTTDSVHSAKGGRIYYDQTNYTYDSQSQLTGASGSTYPVNNGDTVYGAGGNILKHDNDIYRYSGKKLSDVGGYTIDYNDRGLVSRMDAKNVDGIIYNMFNKPAFIYASNPSRESQLVYDVDNTLSYLSESDVSTKKQTRTWFAGPGDDLYEYRESSKDGVIESENALSHVYALNRQPVASFRQSEVLRPTFVEAIQSSESHGAAASRAIDGNTDGIFANGSVTHTVSHYARHWWQGKLDRRTEISSVTLHNRTDCCSDRLKNFTVLISDYDLSGITTLAEAKALSSTSHFHGPALVGNSLKLNFVTGPVKGKYIMVYKEGGNHALSLAEVEVNK